MRAEFRCPRDCPAADRAQVQCKRPVRAGRIRVKLLPERSGRQRRAGQSLDVEVLPGLRGPMEKSRAGMRQVPLCSRVGSTAEAQRKTQEGSPRRSSEILSAYFSGCIRLWNLRGLYALEFGESGRQFNFSARLRECFKTERERKAGDFCSDRGANFMRYPEEITLEVRNEVSPRMVRPDKKRRFTPRSVLKHSLSVLQGSISFTRRRAL